MATAMINRYQARSAGKSGRALLLLLAFALVLSTVSILAPAKAADRERIVQYDSEIWVHSDGTMTVRETIEVEALGQQIRRGIFRDFPTTYEDDKGTRVVVDFHVEEVTRDGKPEPYHTERRGNGVRLYIGDKDVFIPKGRHVYTILYGTNRQLGFFEDFDELYWNVTGNEWAFPIESARAIVQLPKGARVLDHAAYTGPAGATGRNFTYTPLSEGVVRFDTTRPLNPGEGLTIAVSWPVGFVDRPTGTERAFYFISDNSALVVGLIGFGLLLLYYVYMWSKVGRDPEAGVIVAQYQPPDHLSPAGTRYVMRYGFDDKVFTAAIVSMAVKGALTIEEDAHKVYTLNATGGQDGLTPGERAIAAKLFRYSGRIELKQKNHKRLQSAQKALKSKLRNEFEKTYFVRNTKFFVPGVVLSLVALGVLALAADEPAAAGFITLWLAGWTAGVYFLVRKAWRAWKGAVAAGNIAGLIGALVMTLFAVPFVGGEIMGLWIYATTASVGGAVMLLLMQAVNLLFYHLLKAPTLLGRQLMDRIEGFKLYLSVAEQDRMNMLNPPDQTPELFEKYLPYALALDVEQEWAEQFSGVLTAAGTAPGETRHGHPYRPAWYSGHALDRGLSGFGPALGGAFAGAIASASTSPGSRSGSGGGGSSGGGGGGGGGGGW
ncbi:MAG: DUF2207 domain-containing protein [Pseudomonadota bacterium]